MRYLTWFVNSLGDKTPTFYIDRDSEPIALHIYAEGAPKGGDLVVDILDDGVSIMNNNNHKEWTFKHVDAYIEYYTLATNVFSVNEQILGGSSGATAYIVTSDGIGNLTLRNASSTAFTAGETITGQTDSATAVVAAYVKEIDSASSVDVVGQSHAALREGENDESVAEDFEQGIQIDEGSWLSLSILEPRSASGITVQLELEDLSDSVEARR